MNHLSIFNNQINKKFKMFYLNTNTNLDLATGKFQEGISSYPYFHKTNQFYLNGGLSPTFAIVGKSQTYKSTALLSYLSRVLRLYKDSAALVYDTEFAIAGKDRILDIGNELDNYLETDREELKERLILEDKGSMPMEKFYSVIQTIVQERSDHIKDYIIESPFINYKTGKPILTIIPFIIVIDSFSMMQSIAEDELFKKHKISDSETNMVFMNDAKDKSKFMRQIPSMSFNGGVYILLSAHLGKKFNLNPFGDKSKELQYMRADDTIKNVGTQFGFLTNTLIEASNSKTLLDSNKQCEYLSEFGNSPPTELNKVKLTVCRCKNNVSGVTINPVLSQYFGLLNGVSNFESLKQTKHGLEGNNIHRRLSLYKDIDITRKKLRFLLSNDYEFYRALEIINQISFISMFWMLKTSTLQILNKKSINEISEMLIKNKSIKISDILNSRGYWTYDKKEKRKYLSIIDILTLLDK